MSDHCATNTFKAKQADDLPILRQRAVALCSPTVYWMNLAGWLLLASFWMPFAIGCDGTERRASDSLSSSSGSAMERVIVSTVPFMLYSDGVIWALALAFVALAKSRCLFRSISALHLALAFLVIAAILYEDYRQKQLVHTGLSLLPVMLFLVFLVVRPIIRGEDILAWSRLRLLAILAVVIWLHLGLLFLKSLLWGYFVTLIACALMFVAVMVVRHRIEHDLWDSRIPVSRPQFSIKQILVWSTLIAILLTYYKHVQDLATAIAG